MSDNMKSKRVALFGTGNMGVEYNKILKYLDADFSVFGHTQDGVDRFYRHTGIKAIPNGISGYENMGGANVEFAIVAVSVEELAETAIRLMQSGIRNILLEKPAGLNIDEIKRVRDKAEETGSRTVIGYNRRFYSSVLKAQEIIKKDGGVKSFYFEFTEWLHSIPDTIKEQVKRHWFWANSTHVIDLAFFLGGRPKKFSSFISGRADWHAAETSFAGAGVTEKGTLFSYHANWLCPGRWGVEVMTDQNRLIFRPLEKLHIQSNRSVNIDLVEIDEQLDRHFKPGLFRQTKSFLDGTEHPNFLSISSHYENAVNYYQQIVKGS